MSEPLQSRVLASAVPRQQALARTAAVPQQQALARTEAPLQPQGETVAAPRRLVRGVSSAGQSVAGVRVLIAIPDPTFDQASGVILGQDLDLRGKSSPADGWLSLVGPGQGDIDYAAFGTTFFTAKRNQQNRDGWRNETAKYEGIAQEVFRGRFDLMDVNGLREAADAVDNRVRLLDAAIDEMSQWSAAGKGDSAVGNAAAALGKRLGEFVTDFTRLRDQFTVPTPTISATLHEAADALDQFARELSGGWWDSHTVLLNSPDDAVQSIVANIQNYLRQNNLLSDNPTYQSHGSDPASGAAWARGLLAAYSSDAGGGLLPGMDPISGDLTQRAVWDAANASITKRITGEMDKLDAVAKSAVRKLEPKFQAVTDRLKDMPKLFMRARGRTLPAGTPTAGTPTKLRLAEEQPALQQSRPV